MGQYQIRRKSSSKKEKEKDGAEKPATGHQKSHSAALVDTKSSNSRSHRHSEFNTYKAESSPFIIRSHIWPNQKYQFRVRLVSKLFSSKKSAWTKWTQHYKAMPP